MKLRHYETFYLLNPELSEENRTEISEKLQQIITDREGHIVNMDPWPLQKLAYKVQKQSQGYYVLMEYGASAETISEITRSLRLNEDVMKFITMKKGDVFDIESLVNAQESHAPVEVDGSVEGVNDLQHNEI